MKKLFSALFLFLFLVSMTHSEIFKWTDENGNVNYGDKPNSSSQQLDISEKKPKSSSTTKNYKTRKERRKRLTEAMTEDRLKKEEKKAKNKKKKEKRKRQCILAKDRLEQYKRAGVLYNFDKSGNRYNLSDENRNKTILNLEKNIRDNC